MLTFVQAEVRTQDELCMSNRAILDEFSLVKFKLNFEICIWFKSQYPNKMSKSIHEYQ